MTRSGFYNAMRAFEPRYPMKSNNKNSESQQLKRQHEDELTVSSTVTPSSLLSSATSMSNAYSHEVADRTSEQPARFRIIDLADRQGKFRTKRPGIEEEDNESALAPRIVSYKRISPDFLPVMEQTYMVDLQQEQQREEMLEYHRESRVVLRRALSVLHLGSARVQLAQHEQAIPVLEQAAELFGFVQRPIARARCLDLLGQACSNSARWSESISHLFEAFLIREAELGHSHVDTVDTLKHLGEVFFSRNCFAEVFWIHRELFGTDHGCVALAAHNLANAYDAEDDLLQAEVFYRVALDIFHKSGVPVESPTIQGLHNDLRRVQSHSTEIHMNFL